MEIISTDALISINATFFAQLISFLLFMLALNKVMVRPLREVTFKRSDYLTSIQNKIDRSKEQLSNISVELENKKSEIIDNSFSMIGKMEETANNKARDVYDKTKNEIIILQKKYDKETQENIAKLRINLNKDIDNITMLVMEKILDRRLTK